MKKKKLKIRVWENCPGNYWDINLLNGKTTILSGIDYSTRTYAIRRAKQISKILNIPYDPKIIKAHGC